MSREHEPAFPLVIRGYVRNEGLTVREHFAAMAMQGILAGDHPVTHEHNCAAIVAHVAVEFADALIAELKS